MIVVAFVLGFCSVAVVVVVVDDEETRQIVGNQVLGQREKEINPRRLTLVILTLC